jgi:hypothetical protein
MQHYYTALSIVSGTIHNACMLLRHYVLCYDMLCYVKIMLKLRDDALYVMKYWYFPKVVIGNTDGCRSAGFSAVCW